MDGIDGDILLLQVRQQQQEQNNNKIKIVELWKRKASK